jgi:hypothetical protein
MDVSYAIYIEPLYIYLSCAINCETDYGYVSCDV